MQLDKDFIIALAVLAVNVGLLLFLSLALARRSRSVVRLVRLFVDFLIGEFTDVARLFGALVVSLLHLPLMLVSVLIFRLNLARHFADTFTEEIAVAIACVYRIIAGRPLKTIGQDSLAHRIESRFPLLGTQITERKQSHSRRSAFHGYEIVGTLPTGGSGARIYIAEPDPRKKRELELEHGCIVERVVIKNFSLEEGSSLPQILRENRSLDAAVKLGLILEHGLNSERFYHVMHHVPGDNLTKIIDQAHIRESANESEPRISTSIGYVIDLLEQLSRYHAAGLWHKDVKPDNIIIDERDGRAKLVDFGLVTNLRSAMTLTTHGTEYFRDPEMVRMSLKGVKVHEISGVKFDVYGAGAVLYATLENSFPAHGVLSRYAKQSPEALRWIARRAMADYRKRYDSAEAMLTDLRVVASASDPFAVRIADLPGASEDPNIERSHVHQDAFAPTKLPRRMIKLRNWWTGSFDVE